MELRNRPKKFSQIINYQKNTKLSVRSKSQKPITTSHITLINSCDEDPKQNAPTKFRSTCFTAQTNIREIQFQPSDKEQKSLKMDNSFISNNEENFESELENQNPKQKTQSEKGGKTSSTANLENELFSWFENVFLSCFFLARFWWRLLNLGFDILYPEKIIPKKRVKKIVASVLNFFFVFFLVFYFTILNFFQNKNIIQKQRQPDVMKESKDHTLNSRKMINDKSVLEFNFAHLFDNNSNQWETKRRNKTNSLTKHQEFYSIGILRLETFGRMRELSESRMMQKPNLKTVSIRQKALSGKKFEFDERFDI